MSRSTGLVAALCRWHEIKGWPHLRDAADRIEELENTVDRQRYLVIQAIRYIREQPEGRIDYDGTTCDGYCLADDLKADFDIEDEEIGAE